MTVSSTSNKVSLVGNGTNDTFAYNFPIFTGEESTLNVYVDSVEKTLTTHYTVTGAGVSTGGNVVFTSGNIPANTAKVVIERVLARTQLSDWNDYDKFPAETLEDTVDRLTLIASELDEVDSRSLKLATTVTDLGTVEIDATAAARANKVFAFDGSGDLSITTEIGTFQGNWATSTGYVVRDLVKDSSNNNIYTCITAHTSSGSTPISTNTDSAKWSLIVDAASAATSATAAAASETAAAASETAAAASATTATTQAGIATTQAGTSTTQATASAASASAASTSQSAAATSATAAAASYDSFDDRYLGAKSSNPTLDNDGDALVDGALFFHTGNNIMMVYDLGTTTWLRTTPTSTDQGHINTVSGIAANVTTVAGIAANVTTVAGISANTTTVAGISGNVTSVAGIASDVTAVAADASDIGTVAADGTDIGLVAGSIANVNTVATNIANVNRYGSEYTIATSAPGAPSSGDLWYDSSATNQLKFYNGTSWVGIAPGITAETDPNAAALALALG